MQLESDNFSHPNQLIENSPSSVILSYNADDSE